MSIACDWNSFRVQAARLSTGRINCGIDGRLIGVAENPDHAERLLVEELRHLSRDRMRVVVLPSSFLDQLKTFVAD